MVLEVAGLHGWRAFHVRNSRRGIIQGPGGTGFPDLVLVRYTRILYRELKDERRKLDRDQVAWRDALLAAGADWALWRPSSWNEIVRDLTPHGIPAGLADELGRSLASAVANGSDAAPPPTPTQKAIAAASARARARDAGAIAGARARGPASPDRR